MRKVLLGVALIAAMIISSGVYSKNDKTKKEVTCCSMQAEAKADEKACCSDQAANVNADEKACCSDQAANVKAGEKACCSQQAGCAMSNEKKDCCQVEKIIAEKKTEVKKKK